MTRWHLRLLQPREDLTPNALLSAADLARDREQIPENQESEESHRAPADEKHTYGALGLCVSLGTECRHQAAGPQCPADDAKNEVEESTDPAPRYNWCAPIAPRKTRSA